MAPDERWQDVLAEGDPDDLPDPARPGDEMSGVRDLTCPTCGESFEILVDLTQGMSQEWIVDCEVCCRPIRVVVAGSGAGRLEGHSLDEV